MLNDCQIERAVDQARRNAKAFARILFTAAFLLVAPQKTALAQAKAPAFSFELQSTVKNISTIKDGILGAGADQVLPGKEGLNEIQVTATGYSERRIRFWLKAGEKKIVTVDLKKTSEPLDAKWQSPFKSFPADRLGKLPSFCAWFQSKSANSGLCDRKTLRDDLFYSDAPLFVDSEANGFHQRGELQTFRGLVARVGEPSATEALETLYAAQAGNQSLLHLTSLHSLLLGDCPRVYSIYLDALQSLPKQAVSRLHLAYCGFATNQLQAAQRFLEEGLPSGPAPDPGLTYAMGSILIRKNPEKSLELATRCVSSLANRLPCLDLQALSSEMLKKKTKIPSINHEEAIFKSFLEIDEDLADSKYDSLYLGLIESLVGMPHALENFLLLNWVEATQNPAMTTNNYLQGKMRVASIQGGSTLEKIIEAVEKQNQTKLLPPVYARKLAFSPDDPNVWYRLLRAYGKAGQCPELLDGLKAGAKYLPKFNANLLQMEGSCLVDLNRFKEALDAYKKVLEVKPKAWTTYYNLANVFERLKKNGEAYRFFKKTLEFDPPLNIKENVQLKMQQLNPKKV